MHKESKYVQEHFLHMQEGKTYMQKHFLHVQEENMCAGNIPTHVGIFPAHAGRNEHETCRKHASGTYRKK